MNVLTDLCLAVPARVTEGTLAPVTEASLLHTGSAILTNIWLAGLLSNFTSKVEHYTIMYRHTQTLKHSWQTLVSVT